MSNAITGRPSRAERITSAFPDAIRLTGISRSGLYELMKSRELELVKVGVPRWRWSGAFAASMPARVREP